MNTCGCFKLQHQVLLTGDSLANFCIISGTDGIWYGFKLSTFGSINTATAAGLIVYSFMYKDTGEFEFRLGVAGDEQIPDVTEVWVTNDDGSYSESLGWDSVAKAYTGFDLAAANFLIGLPSYCLGMYALPDTFITYNFTRTV